MQADQTNGALVPETELDQVEALDPVPAIAAEALDQVGRSAGPIRSTRSRHKRRNRGGRPIRLTVDTAIRLGVWIGKNKPLEVVARNAGVGVSSLYRWIALGWAGDPRFAELARVAKDKPKAPNWKLYFDAQRMPATRPDDYPDLRE